MAKEKKYKHSIVLKEIDKDGNHLCYDADIVLPDLRFGEGHPFVIGVRGDSASIFPVSDIWCIDQHFGVNEDFELAREIIKQRQSNIGAKNDPAVR